MIKYAREALEWALAIFWILFAVACVASLSAAALLFPVWLCVLALKYLFGV